MNPQAPLIKAQDQNGHLGEREVKLIDDPWDLCNIMAVFNITACISFWSYMLYQHFPWEIFHSPFR